MHLQWKNRDTHKSVGKTSSNRTPLSTFHSNSFVWRSRIRDPVLQNDQYLLTMGQTVMKVGCNDPLSTWRLAGVPLALNGKPWSLGRSMEKVVIRGQSQMGHEEILGL